MRLTTRSIRRGSPAVFGALRVFPWLVESSIGGRRFLFLVPVCNDCLTVCTNEKIYFWFYKMVRFYF